VLPIYIGSVIGFMANNGNAHAIAAIFQRAD
jgi:hypothetical protein